MVHELIGIQDNTVDLRNIGKASKDQQVLLFKASIVSNLFIAVHGEN